MKKSLNIRHFILGEIYRAGDSSIRLESVRRMARRFDVAQCTVSAVMAELIRDQWLFSKKGIGVFTNPKKLAGDARKKLVGLINGDGKLFYYNRDSFDSFASIGKELLAKGRNFRNIMLESSEPDEMADEVHTASLSAVIWCAGSVMVPASAVTMLVNKGVKVVCDLPECTSADVVCHDYTPIFDEWCRYCAETSKRRILISLFPRHCESFAGYFREKMPDAEIVFSQAGRDGDQETYDLILTDEVYREDVPQMKTEFRDWLEIPGTGDCWKPDWNTFAQKIVARALIPFHRGEPSVKDAVPPIRTKKGEAYT